MDQILHLRISKLHMRLPITCETEHTQYNGVAQVESDV